MGLFFRSEMEKAQIERLRGEELAFKDLLREVGNIPFTSNREGKAARAATVEVVRALTNSRITLRALTRHYEATEEMVENTTKSKDLRQKTIDKARENKVSSSTS